MKFPIWLSAGLIAAGFGTATATHQNASDELGPGEQWVVAQVTAGEIADLSKKFPKEEDRKLRAHFLEELLTGALPRIKVHRNGVRIIGAIIDEPIDLTNAQIPCEVWLEHCQFNETVTFKSASFAAAVSFDNSTFKAVSGFVAMHVGDVASFNKAVFEGPARFAGAHMAGPFFANAAQFKDKETGADFYFMKVGHLASFIRAVFEGPMDFRYADFAWLDLSSPSSPVVAAELHMQGMSYKYIRAAPKEPESHTALLKLADQSTYTADVYTNLEEFFKRQGYRGDADRAFIAGKCRERKEYFHSGDCGRWLGSWMLDLLVGYGRHPERAGYIGLGIIVLGCILFPLKKMELQDPKELEKPKEKRRQYNRLWYSLGLFLPVVDLKTSELWGPKPQYRFLRHYLRVHILLGWILVPLVLAALTGLIK